MRGVHHGFDRGRGQRRWLNLGSNKGGANLFVGLVAALEYGEGGVELDFDKIVRGHGRERAAAGLDPERGPIVERLL